VIPWLATPSWLPLAILPPALAICMFLRRFFRSARRWRWNQPRCFVPERNLAVAGVTVSYGPRTLACVR